MPLSLALQSSVQPLFQNVYAGRNILIIGNDSWTDPCEKLSAFVSAKNCRGSRKVESHVEGSITWLRNQI